MKQHVMITGVSTGIGYAVAADLLRRGYRVWGSVRTSADAARLQAEWGENFAPLLFDVTDGVAVETAVAHLRTALQGQNLAGLINNAGISVTGPLMHLSLAEMRQQFEVNVFGLLHVTQQCLPLLGAYPNAPMPRGRIINISSVSGKIAYPFMGAYAASKHALEALSDSLRRELMLYGIDVILIEPGTTQTPIIQKASQGAEQYRQTDYGPMLAVMQQEAVAERAQTAIPVQRVSQVIVAALVSSQPRTRYAIPRKWLTGWLMPRCLPDRWLDWLSARKLGVKKTI